VVPGPGQRRRRPPGLPALLQHVRRARLPAGTPTTDGIEAFVAAYGRAFGPLEAADDLDVDIGDPSVAYDSMFAMSAAMDDVAPTDITPELVANTLANGGVRFLGLTGWIWLSEDHRVPPDKPIFVVSSRGNLELMCGAFSADESFEKWGPDRQFDCPLSD
jgi:hypothetical protein